MRELFPKTKERVNHKRGAFLVRDAYNSWNEHPENIKDILNNISEIPSRRFDKRDVADVITNEVISVLQFHSAYLEAERIGATPEQLAEFNERLEGLTRLAARLGCNNEKVYNTVRDWADDPEFGFGLEENNIIPDKFVTGEQYRDNLLTVIGRGLMDVPGLNVGSQASFDREAETAMPYAAESVARFVQLGFVKKEDAPENFAEFQPQPVSRRMLKRAGAVTVLAALGAGGIVAPATAAQETDGQLQSDFVDQLLKDAATESSVFTSTASKASKTEPESGLKSELGAEPKSKEFSLDLSPFGGSDDSGKDAIDAKNNFDVSSLFEDDVSTGDAIALEEDPQEVKPDVPGTPVDELGDGFIPPEPIVVEAPSLDTVFGGSETPSTSTADSHSNMDPILSEEDDTAPVQNAEANAATSESPEANLSVAEMPSLNDIQAMLEANKKAIEENARAAAEEAPKQEPKSPEKKLDGWEGKIKYGYSLDKFKQFQQCGDARWSNEMTNGGKTFCAVGCGPASAADVIYALTGNESVTPKTLLDTVNARGQFNGFGTNLETNAQLARDYGLRAVTSYSRPTEQYVKDVLKQGGLITIAGEGTEPFVPGGNGAHFITLRAVVEKDGIERIMTLNSYNRVEGSWSWDSSAKMSTQPYQLDHMLNAITPGKLGYIAYFPN